jgi:ribosomal protein S18 acetylase RimI-like enzyme
MAACRLLAQRRSLIDREQCALRYRHMLSSGEFDPSGLFVAKDDAGIVCGAMLAQALSGALGLAWPPHVTAIRDRDTFEDAVISVACRWLQSRGVKVCQAFGSESEREGFLCLERHGFRRVTQLLDMRRAVPQNPVTEPTTIECSPFIANPDAFTTALLLTYDGSLDCPELTGDRSPTELVDGFYSGRLSGQAWWFTVLDGGQPVGIVMWEAAVEPHTLEISYLGLVPWARGHGLGGELVRRTIDFARGRGFHTLSLSVDVRNLPAIRLYERHGFVVHSRRDVYLATWTQPR